MNWLVSIFSPLTKAIDDLTLSKEEKLKLNNKLAEIQASIHKETVDLIKAEASSEHWIVASWRPLCICVLMIIVLLDSYGITKAPQQVYDLFEMFMSVYAGGRSLEKVTKVLKG